MKKDYTSQTLYKGLLAIICLVFISNISFAQSGKVFRDFNANGTQDTNEPLVSGVLVKAYNSVGALCASTTSAGTTSPNYTLPTTCTGQVRVEFEIPASGTNCIDASLDFSSGSGAIYGTSVQFVQSISTNVNYAIQNPGDFNEGPTKTRVYIPCYVKGDPLPAGSLAGLEDWFVGYDYNSTAISTPGVPSEKIGGSIIGSTWGVAYSKQAQKIFTSAFLKRHIGLGKLGSGGIYLLQPTGTSFNVTTFYDMDANGHRTRAASGTYGEGSSFSINSANTVLTFLGTSDPLTGEPNGLGVIGSNMERVLSTDPVVPNYDPAAHDQIGKVGLGDIDISDDGKFLFVMNLYSRLVFRLELNDAFNPTSVINVTSYPLPNPGCVNGKYRPFGLKFYRNKLYIGVVCSGENGGTAADLDAFVYEASNPVATLSINTTPIFSLDLTYTRDNSSLWKPWFNNTDETDDETPILSDIEFSDRNDLLLSFMSRSGHQFGGKIYQHLKISTNTISKSTDGDILIAGIDCSTGAYTLENNGTVVSNGISLSEAHSSGTSQGPGGQEFFNDNAPTGDPHNEISVGALAVLKGTGELYANAYAISNKLTSDAGTLRISTTDGKYIVNSGFVLYTAPDGSEFLAKANGLGDIELSGVLAPIEIGNRVWNDTDKDGIQDAGENGIQNVTIELYADFDNDGVPDGAALATTPTSATGTWYFNDSNVADGDPATAGTQKGLASNKNYLIRVGSADWTSGVGAGDLVGLSLTTANANSSGLADVADSDATIVASIPTIAYKTGDYGQNNHTLDMGFYTKPICEKPNAGSDQTFCQPSDGKYKLNDAPSGQTWVKYIGSSSIDATTGQITGLTAGVHEYILKYTATADCADTIKLVVNPLPSSDITFFDPECINGKIVINASFTIVNQQNVAKFDYISGSTYTGTKSYASLPNITPANSIIILPNPTVTKNYTIRLYNQGGTCFTDKTVELRHIDCPMVCPPNTCLPIGSVKN